MDLSINNIKKVNNQPAFAGLKGAVTPQNTFTLKFIAPPYDKDTEEVQLELVTLEKDYEKCAFKEPVLSKESLMAFSMPNGIIDLDQDRVKALSDGFAYRYKVVDKTTKEFKRYELDPFKKIAVKNKPNEMMNLVDQGRKYAVSPKAGSMYHAFLDANKILDKKGKPKPYDADLVRNHFNKFGGSIKGLTWLLKNTNELEPYRYIMSTPDIGADPTSSHKYWPNNQYRCTSLDDFKEFNRELYLQGKGYVADGAFTSQSLQSPLLHHALKWGKESPFYSMLKLDGDIALGVLPNFSDKDGVKANEHIGVRIVNNPSLNSYKPEKPTYIQFFDERLSSENQRNSEEIIDSYDTMPSDHYEISTHQDSVQPFYFEISPYDNRIKEFFANSNVVYLKDLNTQPAKKGQKSPIDKLLTFDNYKITDKQHCSGATFWDGNVDIIKMNLSNPKAETKEGMMHARQYLLNAASYWTELVQSDLILTTARTKGSKREQIAFNNGVDITKINVNTAKSQVLKQNKSIEDYIKRFPLQSIEVSPELDAIFAEPDFNSNLLANGVKERLKQLANEVISSAVPESLSDTEKAEYKAYLTKTLGNDVVKGLLVYSINKNSLNEDGTINYDKLKEVTLKSFEATAPTSVKQEANNVITKMTDVILDRNAMKAPRAALIEFVKNQAKDISLDDFKMAESIVIQGKAGLNWRFDAAKDIGDLDAVRDGKTLDEIWNGTDFDPGVQKFWADFVTRIHEYNPSAYVINEITCLDELVTQDPYASVYTLDDYDRFKDTNPAHAKAILENLVTLAHEEINSSVKLNENQKQTAHDAANELLSATEDSKRAAAMSVLYSSLPPQMSGTIHYAMPNFSHIAAFDVRLANGLMEKIINHAQDAAKGRNDYEKELITKQVAILKDKKATENEKTVALMLLKAKGAFMKNWKEHLPYAKEMQFLENTNSTTDSNYGALFNKLSEFAGTNPEKASMDNAPGDIEALKNEVDPFINYAQPNIALFSHVFIDNHDKPRALHALAIDMPLFLSEDAKSALKDPKLAELVDNRKDYKNISTRALAVGQVFKKQIDALDSIDDEEKEKLTQSLKNLVNGKASDDAAPSKKRADNFGNLPFEITIRDMFKGAGYDLEDPEVQEKVLDFHKAIMATPMKLQERLWEVMGALIGVNTLFNGTEFAQTGYESSSKNMHVTNRNQVLHDNAKDPRYEQYFNKMLAISGLYKTEGMSATKEGAPISCDIVNLTKKKTWLDDLKADDSISVDHGKFGYFRKLVRNYMNVKHLTLDEVLDKVEELAQTDLVACSKLLDDIGVSTDDGNHYFFRQPDYIEGLRKYTNDTNNNIYAWPIVKYDEFGSKTLSIITNNGMPKEVRSTADKAPDITKLELKSIPVLRDDPSPKKDGEDAKKSCPLPSGTVLFRKVYENGKFVVETQNNKPRKYVINSKGEIEAQDGGKIVLKDTVENFYVPSEDEKSRYAQVNYTQG